MPPLVSPPEQTPEQTGTRARTRSGRAMPALACALGTCLAILVLDACAAPYDQARVVRASAYNSLAGQTDARPRLAAWGDILSDDMKVIAVSHDLLEQGLTRGTRVRIEGLRGEYMVLDKMARRWRNKIDIFMGDDVEAAREWGVREVRIEWRDPRR